VVGTIDIGGKPEFAATDCQGMIFVNNEDKSEIVAFEAKSLEVKKRWLIAPGEGPSGLAIDLKNKRLFSVLETMATARGARTMELDPRTHHVFLATAEFGPAPAPTPEQPRPRPALVPGTFMVLEFGE